MKKRKTKKASMLIVALGVLTLLSVMAVTFAMLMMLEHKAAINYVDGVRANFLATSGKEAAIVFLKQSITDPKVLMNQNLKDRFPWIYNLGDYSIPLEQALMQPNPKAVLSYYGQPGNTYPGGKDHFGVKIIDTNSQFNLNNRFLVTKGKGGKVSDPIYLRILTNLGTAINKVQGVANPIDIATAQLILDYRNQLENQEFATKDQLIDILGEKRYLILRDYITTRSWVDPRAVTPSEELTGSDPYSTIGSLPSVGYQLSKRSPINANTVSREVLIAVMMGIGGRTVYTYNDVDVEKSTNRQIIDSQSDKWKISNSLGQKYEAKQTRVNSLYIWIEPLEYAQAKDIADNLIQYRESQGAFDNFGEFSWVIDQMFAGVLGKKVFNTYWARFGNRIRTRINSQRMDSSNLQNPFNRKGMMEVLKNIVRKGVADCLKANFNPNATVSFFNPNSGVAKVVDKANLLYMPPKLPSGYPKVEVRQTVDFCFSPMGIFEITSLGQVKSKDQTEAEGKVRTITWVYDTVRHTTQSDFEANSDIFGPTQRVDVVTYPEPSVNWELTPTGLYKGLNKGGIPSGSTQLNADNTVVDGRVELAEATDSSERGKANASFYIRWNKKKSGKSWSQEGAGFSNYFGEVNHNRDEKWAYAYETMDFESDQLIRENSSVQKSEGNLMPDGFYNTEFKDNIGVSFGGYRPRYLWYRAGYFDPTPTLPYNKVKGSQTIEQGEYSPDKFGGMEPNIDYYGGVLEFWYKPDVNWHHWITANGVGEAPLAWSFGVHNKGANDLFMGFTFISHVREKAAADSKGKKTKSTGTQLFVYRTAFGDLRATRMYYEIIGEYPRASNLTYPEEPYIQLKSLTQQALDNLKKLDPKTRAQYNKYLGDGEATGLKEYIKAYRLDPVGNGGAYQWPPKEIGAVAAGALDTRIKRGRSDVIIHADRLRWIKAHEWHHFSIRWDDSSTSAKRLEIVIDNNSYLTSIPLPRINEKEFTGTFSKVNEIPGKNRDNFYIGSIFRKQLFVQSGVFKFTSGTNIVKATCHGTIDDVYYFPLAASNSLGIPQRFVNSGRYTNAFSLQDKFSGGIQSLQLGAIGWTTYLPQYWHSTNRHRVYPKMKIQLWLSRYDAASRKLTGMRPILLPAGSENYTIGNFRRNGLLPLVDPKTGQPYTAKPDEWLVYQIELTSGSPQGANIRNVVTPSLDDISLTYFLPQPRTLLETFVLK